MPSTPPQPDGLEQEGDEPPDLTPQDQVAVQVDGKTQPPG